MGWMATWAELLWENKIEGKAFAGWGGREKNYGPKGETNRVFANFGLLLWGVETFSNQRLNLKQGI
jgi:hypothetical protein